VPAKVGTLVRPENKIPAGRVLLRGLKKPKKARLSAKNTADFGIFSLKTHYRK
jgi:hypothetical protein